LRILHLTRSLDPAGGGPPLGIRQLAAAQRRFGHALELATLDAPGAPWLAQLPVPAHALGPAWLKYGYSLRLSGWLREHAGEYDAVIVNGLWQYHGFAAWRALRRGEVPYYVFCHGMLDPWFRRRYPLKHLKKWLYWPWAEYRLLRDARAVLFTCEEERRLAAQSFWLYRARERVVGYGIAAPGGDPDSQRGAFLARFPELLGRRYLLYLGRVHPKKGADLLVAAFAAVAQRDPQLRLVIAGAGDEAWIAQLRAEAQRLGVAGRIAWTGMLEGKEKWGAVRAAECFVLPSHQENFGIAVVEAMACGVPVLISDQVNIWREIDADRAGLVAADDADGTRRLLERWLGLPAAERSAMGARALQSFRSRFHIEAAACRLNEVLSEAAGAPALERA
jgi:glycosyltransferase involved in cell wall biosynthesis